MHNTGRVFSFELQSILNKKSVQVTTIIMSLLLFAATCIPTVMTFFQKEKPVDPNPTIVDVGNSGILLASDAYTKEELTFYVGDKVVFYTDEQHCAPTYKMVSAVPDSSSIRSLRSNPSSRIRKCIVPAPR
jgi:hypothetical protein